MEDPDRLDNLAEELTRHLGIPFIPTAKGTIVFRDRLRVTDWAVPMIFDGHVSRDASGLRPVDFVAHALWPTLRSTGMGPRRGRAWWSCTMSRPTAEAIVEHLVEATGDDRLDSSDDGWAVELLIDSGPAGARLGAGHPHPRAA